MTGSRTALTVFRIALPIVSVVFAAACGTEAYFEVEDVPFERTQVMGLGADRLQELTLIASVGIEHSRAARAPLGRIVIEKWGEDAAIERLRHELALERAGVTDSVLAIHYSTQPEYELVVRHLVIRSERFDAAELRSNARARASAARDRAEAGEPFAEVAADVSEEPGAAERGGLLEPGRVGTWVPEFWEAASRLETGGLSDVVETVYGYHIIELQDRRAVPFDEARDRAIARMGAQLEDARAWTARLEEWGGDAAGEALVEPSHLEHARVREGVLSQAVRRGIDPGRLRRDELMREWETRISGWAAVFGFTPGMSPKEIADQAVSALGDTSQSARIARRELVELAEEVGFVYPLARTES